jgi:hypothetical protein
MARRVESDKAATMPSRLITTMRRRVARALWRPRRRADFLPRRAVAQGYGGSPNVRRTASMSAHVGRPDSLPRYWILYAAAARANRRCSSQV